MKKLYLAGLAVLLQTTLCLGDVYVKNKLFKGETTGSGQSTMVEAEAMLKALGVSDFKIESGQIIIGDKTVSMEGKLASLKSLTDALGARMILNPEFGTIDVYQGVRKEDMVAAEPVEKKPRQPGYMKPPQGWLTSWDKALLAAKNSNRPVLINFTGSDWCGWCMKLKAEVFNTPTFKSWADKNVILMEVDSPRGFELPEATKAQNDKLKQQFRVSGFPTIVFTDSQGNPVGSYGYDEGGPDNWIKNAESKLKR